MLNTKITVKPYPTEDKDEDFKQVSKRHIVQDEATQKRYVAAVIPQLTVCRFEYDRKNQTGEFVAELEDGKPIVKKGRPIQPYIVDDNLKEVVRLAQILQRPVLLKGEPGSGKTQLAKSVAFDWYGDNYKQHFFEWQVKSTSRAVDGLYHFDHVARLRNAQLAKNKNADEKEDLLQYRTFGPLAQAFLTSTAESPSILLIDEIDKADIDFPNDLLLELDERRFTIPESETGETIEARYPPLIFITSNDERELPEAFLRRCLFMYIRFPSDDQVRRIIDAHIPGLLSEQGPFVDLAISAFHQLRLKIEGSALDNKRVSTSELLDWLLAYHYELKESGGTLDLEQELDKMRFYQTLLKTQAAVLQHEKDLGKKS